MIMAEIMEPLDHNQRSFQATTQDQITRAKAFWADMEERRVRLETQQDRYYRLSSDAEQTDVDIEQALLDHERGLMTLEQVQRITNQTLNVKYRAELASQDYKQEVERMNEFLLVFNKDYRPILLKIQKAEEQRIEFLKVNLEKFIKHFFTLGSQLLEKSAEFQNTVNMMNCETDVRIFIDEHKTELRCPQKVEYRPYEHSDDIKKQKDDLINKINQQKIAKNQHLIEEELKQNEIDLPTLNLHIATLLAGADISYD